MRVTLVTIAAACHSINKAFCEANGDDSQPHWDNAPQWQRESAINGVALHITDPHMSPAASHESWLAQKKREGWKFGKEKNPEKKTHPCYLPYDKLPAEQKAKDYLFKATVAAVRPLLAGNEFATAADLAQKFHAASAPTDSGKTDPDAQSVEKKTEPA